MTDEEGFTPLADALAAVRAELGFPADDVVGTLVARWPEVVGSDVAVHAHLLSVRDGVAVIAVDSPPWATELRYLEPVLVARARAVTGSDAVRSVSVRVRPAEGGATGPGASPDARGGTARKPPNSRGASGTME
jgi:predicted nucleic acid-binding Zn ribbon protein